MTLYEFNQLGYGSLPEYTQEQINMIAQSVRDFIERSMGHYYMLLNNELKYYTVFIANSFDIAYEIMDIVLNLGALSGVEVNENSIEFWVKDTENNTCDMYMLFNYDEGVIEG